MSIGALSDTLAHDGPDVSIGALSDTLAHDGPDVSDRVSQVLGAIGLSHQPEKKFNL